MVAPRCNHLVEAHERLIKQIVAVQRQIEAHRSEAPLMEGEGPNALELTQMQNIHQFYILVDLMRREHPGLFGDLQVEGDSFL